MFIRFFRSVRFRNDWEVTANFWRLQVRIGRSQIAVWWKLRPLVMWLSPRVR